MSGQIAYKVEQLRPAYDTLQRCARELKAYVVDTRDQHWCFVPTALSDQAREASDYEPTIDDWFTCADTLTRMTMDSAKVNQHAGVLVSDDPQLQRQLETFNQAKQTFQSTVALINPKPKSDSSERTLFNEWLIKSRRESEFTHVLGLLGAKEVNLASAYRAVRITADPVLRYAYTWDKNRRRSRVISLQTVNQLISHIASKNELQATYYQQELAALASRSPRLLHITHNNPVLRANVTYLVNPTENLTRRQLIIATGITAIMQSDLPAIVWRDKPDEETLRAQTQAARAQFEERYRPVIPELGVYYDRHSIS